jgi:hypothetical protein
MHDAQMELLKLVREDGRPEVYDVAPHGKGDKDGYQCFICDAQGHGWRRYDTEECFMTSPVNTPGNKVKFVCLEHLPDEAVIYNPATDMCRSKNGENVWQELPE